MIYADYNSTTPCLPEVADIARQVMLEDFGNPSQRASIPGRKARGHLDQARDQVAAAMGAEPDEIFFTSGATEACNTSIFGVVQRLIHERPKILVSAIEHSAVLKPVERCREAGAEVEVIPVDAQGRLNLAALRRQIDQRTALVCVMAVNNQTGVVQDTEAIASICHESGALLFSDLTQGLGKCELNVATMGVDLAAVSAHKLYGPKGVGALYKRRGLALSPLLLGGGQEEGFRSGTENVPGISGFGLAAERARLDLKARRQQLSALTSRLEQRVREELPGANVQCAEAERVPGTSMITMPGLQGNWLAQLSGVVASAGSACASKDGGPSHVLLAMGVAPEEARHSIRISLGIPSTESEVDQIADALIAGAQRLRADS